MADVIDFLYGVRAFYSSAMEIWDSQGHFHVTGASLSLSSQHPSSSSLLTPPHMVPAPSPIARMAGRLGLADFLGALRDRLRHTWREDYAELVKHLYFAVRACSLPLLSLSLAVCQ